MQDISPVIISPEGKFKYILITGKVYHNYKEESVYFIRGDANLSYHAHNFEQFIKELQNKGFDIKKKNIDHGNF